eukprot:scaffold653512_cov37-Prasinocladus_malaysianus.AAC.1
MHQLYHWLSVRASEAPETIQPWLADLMDASVMTPTDAVAKLERIYASVISTAMAEKPSLVVVEGLQWLDQSSWNVLWNLNVTDPAKPEKPAAHLRLRCAVQAVKDSLRSSLSRSSSREQQHRLQSCLLFSSRPAGDQLTRQRKAAYSEIQNLQGVVTASLQPMDCNDVKKMAKIVFKAADLSEELLQL